MLRISEEGSSSEVVVLRLEGQAIGPWVEELRKSCEGSFSNNRQLVLDLGEVSYADRSAITLFRELIEREVLLINCSPLVAEQLKQSAGE